MSDGNPQWQACTAAEAMENWNCSEWFNANTGEWTPLLSSGTVVWSTLACRTTARLSALLLVRNDVASRIDCYKIGTRKPLEMGWMVEINRDTVPVGTVLG